MAKTIEVIFSAVIGFFSYFLGGFDSMLTALLVVIICDYISGCLVAIAHRQLSSEIGFKGIAKKILIIGLVGVANLVDVHVMGTGNALRTATLTFFFINECVSIIENASSLGLPVPEKLKSVLKQIKNKEDKKDGNKGN